MVSVTLRCIGRKPRPLFRFKIIDIISKYMLNYQLTLDINITTVMIKCEVSVRNLAGTRPFTPILYYSAIRCNIKICLHTQIRNCYWHCHWRQALLVGACWDLTDFPNKYSYIKFSYNTVNSYVYETHMLIALRLFCESQTFNVP